MRNYLFLVLLFLGNILYAGQASLDDSNVVALYHYNEGVGVTTAYDSSSYKNIGVLIGTPERVSGKYGFGLDFDGSVDYVLTPTNPSLNGMANLSISMWIKFKSLSTNMIILQKGNTHGSATKLDYFICYNYFTAGNKINFYVGGSGVDEAGMNSDATPAINKWIHLVCISEGGKSLYMYVNGVKQSGASWMNKVPPAVINSNVTYADLQIGAGHYDGSTLNYFPVPGLIDEVVIHKKVLTSGEVQKLFTAGIGAGGICVE